MLVKGLRFGMLLQFAIGPITLLLFQIGAVSGFATAMTGVAGVTLVDALFVIAAISGVGMVLKRHTGIEKGMKIFGAVVMMVFGLSIILESFGLTIIPSLNLAAQTKNAFIRTAFLTAANPMTILFWAGVFSGKIVEDDLKKRDMVSFGAGAVLSTLLFQTFVSWVGSTMKLFLNDSILLVLNVTVGLVLVIFGMKMLNRVSTTYQPVTEEPT